MVPAVREAKPKVRVAKPRKVKANVTDNHMQAIQVKNLTDYEMYDWDSEKVIEALARECGLGRDVGTKIANDVFQELVSHGKTDIDVSTLKSFINHHLFLSGYNGKILSGQVNLGMSLDDMNALIREKSSENSNISNNSPEAINMVIAENALKKYALKSVFSKDVSEAHLNGLVHLHDLGSVTKNYAFSVNTSVRVRINGEESVKTLMEIYNTFGVKEERLSGNHYEKNFKDFDVTVMDRGRWVKIQRIVSIKEKKKMYRFTTKHGVVSVTEEHGCIVKRGGKVIITRADEVRKEDRLIKV